MCLPIWGEVVVAVGLAGFLDLLLNTHQLTLININSYLFLVWFKVA